MSSKYKIYVNVNVHFLGIKLRIDTHIYNFKSYWHKWKKKKKKTKEVYYLLNKAYLRDHRCERTNVATNVKYFECHFKTS